MGTRASIFSSCSFLEASPGLYSWLPYHNSKTAPEPGMITMSLPVAEESLSSQRTDSPSWSGGHPASSLRNHGVEYTVYAESSHTSRNPTIPEQSLRVSQSQADFAQTRGPPRTLKVSGGCRGQRETITGIPYGTFTSVLEYPSKESPAHLSFSQEREFSRYLLKMQPLVPKSE